MEMFVDWRTWSGEHNELLGMHLASTMALLGVD
jgi:hypothetical protein